MIWKNIRCRNEIKNKFFNGNLQELINYYRIAIEYYKSKTDERYKRYSTSLNLLLSNPDVFKKYFNAN